MQGVLLLFSLSYRHFLLLLFRIHKHADRKLIESEEYLPGKVCVFHVSTSVLFHCTVVSL